MNTVSMKNILGNKGKMNKFVKTGSGWGGKLGYLALCFLVSDYQTKCPWC